MEINTKPKTFEIIFNEKDSYYVVPPYQRDYSWKKEQIKDLWDDIRNAMESGVQSYFLGPVTMLHVNDNDPEYQIIDGQQRFTTIYILLSVILEFCNDTKLDTRNNIGSLRENIKKYLSVFTLMGEIKKPKLILNEHNDDFFNAYIVDIQKQNLTKNERENIESNFRDNGLLEFNEKIRDAYSLLYSYIDNYVKDQDCETTINLLVTLIEYITKNVELVLISVKDEGDAYIIFESLNDRGLELSQVDLVKNKLFKNLAINKNAFIKNREKWNNLTKDLRDQETIMKYLIHYWRAKHKHVTKKNFFNSFKNEIGNDYNISLKLLDDLKKYSTYYYAILNPHSTELWEGNDDLIFTLEWMQKLGYTSVIPLILATIIKYPSNKNYIRKIARLSFNFLVRYVSVSKNKISSVEKNISSFAEKLKDDNIQFDTWIQNLSEYFSKFSADISFKEDLKTYEVGYELSSEKSNLGYYLVSLYDIKHPKRHDKMTLGEHKRKNLTLEHILPLTTNPSNPSGQYWIKQFGDDIEHYKNRLGNFTLLNQEAQSKCSNCSYSHKLKIYESNADSCITRELFENQIYNIDWNPEILNKRQDAMAEVLVEHISLDVEKL